MPILTQYTCFTSKTAEQLQALLYPSVNAPQETNQRIIDLLTGINGGQMSGSIQLQINGIKPTQILTYTGIPAVGGTFAFAGITLTSVSGTPANENQFQIGGTTLITATNLANAINNHSVLKNYLTTSAVNLAGTIFNFIYQLSTGVTLNLGKCVSTLTNASLGTTFVNGTNGLYTTFNEGINTPTPSSSNFKVVLFTEDSQTSMLNQLNPSSSNSSQSMINLINMHNTLGIGRAAYMAIYVGASPWSAQLVFLNNILVSDTLSIAGITYTCVASGATGTQFNLGASVADTVVNLYNVLIGVNNIVSQNLTFSYDISNAPASAFINMAAKQVGIGTYNLTASESLTGAILNITQPTNGSRTSFSLGLPNSNLVQTKI
jgi:hypothetical protein